jgi:hypothetical protein
MASIIIDEILPTKWRLRLRDAEGKTREVEYKTGTALQVDLTDEVVEAETRRSGKDSKSEHKERSKDAGKPKSAASKPAKEKPSRAPAAKDSRTSKAGRAEKPEMSDPKPESVPDPPQLRRRKPDPGKGPGELTWEEIEDDGVPGVRAPFARGAFKILHAGGDAFALFYEWNSGKYQTLSCGALEVLKQTAAQWTEDGKLRAPRSNLGAEAAKVACAPNGGTEEAPATTPTPPPAREPSPAPPPVDPEKDRLMMQGFEATVQKLMASRKGAS